MEELTPPVHLDSLDPKQQICFDFTKGLCTRGDACKYSHDIALIVKVNSQERGICFDFLRGQCSRGLLCRFSHDLSNITSQTSQVQQAFTSRSCQAGRMVLKPGCSRICVHARLPFLITLVKRVSVPAQLFKAQVPHKCLWCIRISNTATGPCEHNRLMSAAASIVASWICTDSIYQVNESCMRLHCFHSVSYFYK